MPAKSSVTAYVARFIVGAAAKRIPANVMHLGKRSILDGLGLALAGNAAESGHLVRTYLATLGLAGNHACTVIGTNVKLPPRFAAFANGIAIHADDYDDTQLAVAKDRVYGLLTHPGMGLMLDLIRQHDIRPAQVTSVKVGTNRHLPNTLIHHRPKNELQAKFSMEFCMAILLLERKAGLAQFTDEVVNRRDVQSMIRKIEFGVHPRAEAAGYEKMTTIIDIKLADGRTVSGHADFGKGSPVNPMSDDELSGKFRECAAWGGLSRAKADKVVDLVFGLERVKSIREVTRLLTIGAATRAAGPKKNIASRRARRKP